MKRVIAALTGLIACALSAPAAAKNFRSLADCLALADARATELKIARDRIDIASSQLDEVRMTVFSHINFQAGAGVGIMSDVQGSNVYSPNHVAITGSHLDYGFNVSLDGYVPLFTFGKFDAQIDQAKVKIKLATIDSDRILLAVHHNVRQAYMGLLIAHDLRYLFHQAEDKITNAEKRMTDSPDADEIDQIRLSMSKMELSARFGQIVKFEGIAGAGLAFLTGDPDVDVLDAPTDDVIAEPTLSVPAIDALWSKAHDLRPELRAARDNFELADAKRREEQARMAPEVGLTWSIGYSRAPQVADQINPWVTDGANFFHASFGVALKTNFDFIPGPARLSNAEAARDEMELTLRAKERDARSAIERAAAMAREAESRSHYLAEAEKLSKRWVASVSQSISLGTKDDSAIIEPLKYYLTERAGHLLALSDFVTALSQLCVETGDDTLIRFGSK